MQYKARPRPLTAKARLLRVGQAPGVLGLGPAPSSSVPHGEEALALGLMLSCEDAGRQRGIACGPPTRRTELAPGSVGPLQHRLALASHPSLRVSLAALPPSPAEPKDKCCLNNDLRRKPGQTGLGWPVRSRVWKGASLINTRNSPGSGPAGTSMPGHGIALRLSFYE